VTFQSGGDASGPAPAVPQPLTEQLHRVLVSSVREYAIFALDRDGYIRTWNTGAERIKGWSEEEIVGRHFSTFYPPEDLDKPARELEIATREGAVEDEGWRLRKDGTRFWANVVITALRDAEGTLIGFAKVTRDLTERRAEMNALRRSEERFRLLVQGVRDYGIFMLDPDGRIASWNEGASRIKGYSASEVIGQHFSIFYPPEDNAAGKPDAELALAASRGSFEDEGWRLRKDGTPFWANVIITAIRDHTGKLVGFAKVTRDLTERREYESRALDAARRVAEIEASSRAKSEFLATLSHELRTPLNAIGGYAELLAMGVQGPVTPEQREYLERIRRSQHHLLAIINDLLNYSRLEAGAFAYQTEPVPLGEMIDAVTGMVEPQIRAKGLTLRVEHTGRPGTVMADRLKTEQILLNLLSNALKFTPAGGTITVSSGRREGVAELAVRDTGVGIPQDKLDSVFEPFVQLGRSLATPYEGTGLGLAISRTLAQGMGGDLDAVSSPGSGSVFTLTLPLAPVRRS
jgi:PAS domain S-box-containing protein